VKVEEDSRRRPVPGARDWEDWKLCAKRLNWISCLVEFRAEET